MTRRRASATALVVAVAGLTACSPIGMACSAVGYGSTVFVSLDTARAGLTVEACDGAGCTPGGADLPVEAGAAADPAQTGVMGITGDSRNGWSVSMLGGQDVIGFRVTDAAGVVVAAGESAVEWVRVDGSAQCGGNREAQLVISV